MEANKSIISFLIDGNKQFQLPLFQRNYTWTKREWEVLWDDLNYIADKGHDKSHFLGAIVTLPMNSGPDAVAKYIVIDGQQRLTTLYLILCAVRDIANELGDVVKANEINDSYLVNKYKEGDEHYKVLSSQKDRETLKNLIGRGKVDEDSLLVHAYKYFYERIRKSNDYKLYRNIITHYLYVVSITLDQDDNPYLVFESLNAKGKPLTQADLIKNHLFMRIQQKEQEVQYKECWFPMEQALGEKLTEFIRHFLMKDGDIVKNSEVYDRFKDSLGKDDARDYLTKLAEFGTNYQKLLEPEFETHAGLQRQLKRINRIEVTTAYPLLLKLYEYVDSEIMTKEQFVLFLEILENYLIRRYLMGIATNQLNKIFPSLISVVKEKSGEDIARTAAEFLTTKGYPKDSDILRDITERKMYGGGDRQLKTKFILESIEESFNHKERINLDNLTIEHIMPKTLNEWWMEYLGDEGIEWHDDYVDVIGNLTLTGYNSELSNMSFDKKKEFYAQSHLEINRYFDSINSWQPEDVRERSLKLASLIIDTWKYFGNEYTITKEVVTGLYAIGLIFNGKNISVQSWRDVLNETLNVLYDLDPVKFEELALKNPTFLSKVGGKFKTPKIIRGTYFAESQLNSQTIFNFCKRALKHFGFSEEEWVVRTVTPEEYRDGKR
ncbi:MAG: DUF262 domain-containing HNH endonuclease family protein [Bacteroidetes bacterium]|nr:DUF262 domain-containing HNH endonuclease family protein [Bacteroidota bacterium]